MRCLPTERGPDLLRWSSTFYALVSRGPVQKTSQLSNLIERSGLCSAWRSCRSSQTLAKPGKTRSQAITDDSAGSPTSSDRRARFVIHNLPYSFNHQSKSPIFEKSDSSWLPLTRNWELRSTIHHRQVRSNTVFRLSYGSCTWLSHTDQDSITRT